MLHLRTRVVGWGIPEDDRPVASTQIEDYDVCTVVTVDYVSLASLPDAPKGALAFSEF